MPITATPTPGKPPGKRPGKTAANDAAERFGRPEGGWRLRLYSVIFESDTPAGRLFDLVLIGFILTSVITVALDSVASIHARWQGVFNALEWFFTLAFTAEYVCRLLCVRRPARYMRSPLGIIDLLALLPTPLDDLQVLLPQQVQLAAERRHIAQFQFLIRCVRLLLSLLPFFVFLAAAVLMVNNALTIVPH